ncbi:MAG TPA: condensation domain-containing protein, partial [Gammaproteobacteria bacterium]|nr:condensation domain-containing protein [Gammaproteobacteria bacterium]
MDDTSRNEGDLLPLTRAQRLLWTGQQLAPRDPLYNMVLAFRIRGPLEVPRFVAAFGALIARCDALRVVIEERDGVPRQRFLQQLRYELPVVDFADQRDPERARRDWIDVHRGRQFSTGSPMFESALLKAGDGDFVWYLNQHHVITDAWSVSVIYHKMRVLYRAVAEDGVAAVPDMPSFRDYVLAENARAASPRRAKAAAYWQRRLGAPPAASAFYRARPRQPGGRTQRVPVAADSSRSARIEALLELAPFRAFTRDLGKFQIMATALFAYLFRATGNRELTIGTPSHGRTNARSKELAGLLVELFPLSVEVDDDETFVSLYRKVAARTQELLMNAEPGITSVENNRSFDVVLNYITASFGDFAGLRMESEWVHSGFGDRNHLLRMQVHDFDETAAINVDLDLNEDAFVGEERNWAARHLRILLDALLDDPGQAIELPELTDQDARSRRIDSVNGPAGEARVEVTVVEMLARQAAATPDAIALVCGDDTLTYRELDRCASQVAARLVPLGAGPGVTIALAMRRSVAAVVAMLGVLKAGAAYVPVDPDYPQQRIDFIVEDSGALLVLAVANDHVPPRAGAVQTLEIDDWVAPGAYRNADVTLRRVGPSDVAYVIYTSGSTGQPKGVLVTHGGLANYVAWSRAYYLRGEVL